MRNWLLAIFTFRGIILFNGFVYFSAYNLGFIPFIESVGFNSPNIGYNIFILFAAMMQLYQPKNEKLYDIDDYEGWQKMFSNLLNKLFILGILGLLYLTIL